MDETYGVAVIEVARLRVACGSWRISFKCSVSVVDLMSGDARGDSSDSLSSEVAGSLKWRPLETEVGVTERVGILGDE
jgi:hypothetical protein